MMGYLQFISQKRQRLFPTCSYSPHSRLHAFSRDSLNETANQKNPHRNRR